MLYRNYKVFPCDLLRVTLVPSGSGDDDDDDDDDDGDGNVGLLNNRGKGSNNGVSVLYFRYSSLPLYLRSLANSRRGIPLNCMVGRSNRVMRNDGG